MPAKFVSNKDETIPLFKSPWLERMSHIHPATPAVVFLPVAGWFLWQGLQGASWLAVAGLVVAGLFIWTLTEYSLHRWVFHYQPTTDLGKKLHFLMHGVHHDYPQDHTRLVMPPPVSIPLAAGFGLAFSLVFGAHYEAIFAGFLVGYVIYDTTHYATHHWKMQSRRRPVPAGIPPAASLPRRRSRLRRELSPLGLRVRHGGHPDPERSSGGVVDASATGWTRNGPPKASVARFACRFPGVTPPVVGRVVASGSPQAVLGG